MSSVLLRVLLMVMALMALSPPSQAFAETTPRVVVRARFEPSGPVVAGGEVKLVVDILTTTWFTEAPDWPQFSVVDAMVSLPDEEAQNLSEDINGERWFGVSRAYRIAPQAGKTYDIAPFSITVHPGGTDAPMEVKTPALKLVAMLPPGAQGMASFFATSKLTATQDIEPANRELRPGDSVTRTITQRATGTESMLIPPVAFGNISGMKRYLRTPVTRNVMQDRAGLVAGERADSVTYVADHGGQFELPPLRIEWWNVSAQKKEVIELPAVKFSVTAAREKPLFEIPIDAITDSEPHRILVIHGRQVVAGAAICIALVVLASWRMRLLSFVRRLRQNMHDARVRYVQSDFVAWRAFALLTRKGDWRRIIPALYHWMDRSGECGRPAQLANLPASENSEVAKLATAVQRHYTGTPAPSLHWKRTLYALRRATRWTRSRRRKRSPLPPLNDC